MKVRAKRIAEDEIPVLLKQYVASKLITSDREYEVHGVVVFDGIAFFQFVDDLDDPNWMPSWCFSPTDPAPAQDWICNAISSGDGQTLFLLGPEFVVRDEAAYDAMVSLDPEQVHRFWKRLNMLQHSKKKLNP